MEPEKLYLHAVIVKKPISLALARLRAQEFIRNKDKTFYTETGDTFRFRNIPKQSFKDFVSKKINDEITLVLGNLSEKAAGGSDMATDTRPNGM